MPICRRELAKELGCTGCSGSVSACLCLCLCLCLLLSFVCWVSLSLSFEIKRQKANDPANKHKSTTPAPGFPAPEDFSLSHAYSMPCAVAVGCGRTGRPAEMMTELAAGRRGGGPRIICCFRVSQYISLHFYLDFLCTGSLKQFSRFTTRLQRCIGAVIL